MAPLFNINCNFDGKLIQKLLVAILGKKFITEDQAATTEALRHHELEMAQTEKDAERIKKGELDYTQNILVANHSSELPTINPQQELILREIVKDIVVREIQHRVNLNHVQRFALEAANEVPDSEVLDKEVDDDWWTRFRGYAEDVSSKELQEIWGRLLAGEFKVPGSFSLRSLEILKILTPKDAKRIEKYASFRIDNLIFIPPSGKKEFLSKYDMAYDDFLALEELGIITLKEGHAKMVIRGTTPIKTMWHSNGKGIGIEGFNDIYEIKVPGYMISKAGTQIMGLAKVKPNLDYLMEVGAFIKLNGASVVIGDLEKATQLSDHEGTVYTLGNPIHI